MITHADFLAQAVRLAALPSEADWRTSISRAYYAAFHATRELLEDLGFRVPRADRAHAYLSMRLNNCGAPPVQAAATDLKTLRDYRNLADYDLHLNLRQATAAKQAQVAAKVIQALALAGRQPTRTQIADAMRVYERDVLKDVTYQKP